jgi:hypothetical protein
MMEKLVEWWLAGETELLAENLHQGRFVHHKPHMLCPDANPGRYGGKPGLTAWGMARPANPPILEDQGLIPLDMLLIMHKSPAYPPRNPGKGLLPGANHRAGGIWSLHRQGRHYLQLDCFLRESQLATFHITEN